MKTVMKIEVIQVLDEENIEVYKSMSQEEVQKMFKVWEEESLEMLQNYVQDDFTMKFKAYVEE